MITKYHTQNLLANDTETYKKKVVLIFLFSPRKQQVADPL